MVLRVLIFEVERRKGATRPSAGMTDAVCKVAYKYAIRPGTTGFPPAHVKRRARVRAPLVQPRGAAAVVQLSLCSVPHPFPSSSFSPLTLQKFYSCGKEEQPPRGCTAVHPIPEGQWMSVRVYVSECPKICRAEPDDSGIPKVCDLLGAVGRDVG